MPDSLMDSGCRLPFGLTFTLGPISMTVKLTYRRRSRLEFSLCKSWRWKHVEIGRGFSRSWCCLTGLKLRIVSLPSHCVALELY